MPARTSIPCIESRCLLVPNQPITPIFRVLAAVVETAASEVVEAAGCAVEAVDAAEAEVVTGAIALAVVEVDEEQAARAGKKTKANINKPTNRNFFITSSFYFFSYMNALMVTKISDGLKDNAGYFTIFVLKNRRRYPD